MCDRTNYDKQMQEMYNPMVEKYHKQPFPAPRTQADMELQKKWCPTCPQSYTTSNQSKENFTHDHRTGYDKELQQKWCPNCKYHNKVGN